MSPFHADVDRLRWEAAEAITLNVPLEHRTFEFAVPAYPVVGNPLDTLPIEAADPRAPNLFEQILSIAQQQLEAVARGDLEAAVAKLDRRGALVAQLPVAQARDTGTLEEIMRLDRVLSGAIRERMVAIRDEAAQFQGGKHGLDGYA